MGVVAQSGAMAANVRDALSGRGLPLTAVVSTGNEAVLGLEDVLAHYIADAQTRVIAVYAEQVRRPQTFLPGAAGARGGQAGGDADAGAQCAGTRGRAVAYRCARWRSRHRLGGAGARSRGAGGFAGRVVRCRCDPAVVSGAAERRPGFHDRVWRDEEHRAGFLRCAGLDLPALGEQTTARLQAMLPAYAVAENPLDYTTISVRQPGLVGELLLAMLADDNIGSIVLSIPAGPTVAQRDKAEHIVPALARRSLRSWWSPATQVRSSRFRRRHPRQRRAVLPLPDRALRALRRVTAYGEALQRARRANRVDPVAVALPAPRPPSGVFAEYQGKAWLAAAGVAVPAGGLAQSVEDAATIAASPGYPVVIKAQASELPHKSDVGGVIIGLGDEAALRAGWQQLQDNVAVHRPGLRLDGVLVEDGRARARTGGRGAPRRRLGPVVLVGLGGIWIEALEDVRLLPADLAEEDIVTELGRLKAALAAARHSRCGGGRRAGDRARGGDDRNADACQSGHPEIDVNPLLAYPDRVLALDAGRRARCAASLRQRNEARIFRRRRGIPPEVRAFVRENLPADIEAKGRTGPAPEHLDYVTWFRIPSRAAGSRRLAGRARRSRLEPRAALHLR